MNLIGKIFTILIFVMCLVFMSFAVMVYDTHKNWRLEVDNPKATPEHPEGLTQLLTKEKTVNEKLKQENKEVNDELVAKKKELERTIGKLETQKSDLEKTQAKDEADLRGALQAQTASAEAMKKTEVDAANIRSQNEALQASLEKAKADRDENFKRVVDLTDKLHGIENEKNQLSQRMSELSAELVNARKALKWFGINEKSDYRAAQPPHPLEGAIQAVTADNLVEINLGSDDGLMKGHKLEVVRSGGVYVGRIEVVSTMPDRAVCRVIPEMLKSPMQRGDRVHDKLD